MKLEKNSPNVWNSLWDDNDLLRKSLYDFNKEKKSIHWKRMKKVLIKKFGKLNGLNSIEIGAGRGIYSLILASEGVNVTLLDYSKEAIKKSKVLFKQNHQKANFILQDALNLDKNLFSRYDISMSFGTAEHFIEKNRIKMIQTHFDVLNKGGITFISVPNKKNFLYRIHKFLSQCFGKWKFGEEHPFSRKEFKKIGKILNQDFFFIGHNIFYSPFLIIKRIKRIFGINEDYNIQKLKEERGTFLDKYFSVFIDAVSEKK